MRPLAIPLVLSLAALALSPVAPARAATPTEELKTYTDRVVKILENRSLTAQQRRAAVREVAGEVFDVEEVARRAMAQHWAKLNPADRQEFVQLFSELLELTYITRIDEYGGERLTYVDEQVEGERAVVRAKIVTRSGTEVPVDSRLLRKSGKWMIYDILIEGVSLVGNYRTQFDRVMRTGGYQELSKRLRERLATMRTQTPVAPRTVPARGGAPAKQP
jgi:phospholipid transport system substrate-binding protein